MSLEDSLEINFATSAQGDTESTEKDFLYRDGTKVAKNTEFSLRSSRAHLHLRQVQCSGSKEV